MKANLKIFQITLTENCLNHLFFLSLMNDWPSHVRVGRGSESAGRSGIWAGGRLSSDTKTDQPASQLTRQPANQTKNIKQTKQQTIQHIK